MPALLKKCSGKECVRILCNKFGFSMKRQKGSHVVLRKETQGCTIPLHNSLAVGTLRGAIRQAGITVAEFVRAFEG